MRQTPFLLFFIALSCVLMSGCSSKKPKLQATSMHVEGSTAQRDAAIQAQIDARQAQIDARRARLNRNRATVRDGYADMRNVELAGSSSANQARDAGMSDDPIADALRNMRGGVSPSYHSGGHDGRVDVSAVASSSSVEVFSLDAERTDPFARSNQRVSVVDNTTASGYTVLEPGVQVFSVDNASVPVGYVLERGGVQQNTPQRSQFDTVVISGRKQNMAEGDVYVEPLAGDFNDGFDRRAENLPPIVEQPQLTMPAPSSVREDLPTPFIGENSMSPRSRSSLMTDPQGSMGQSVSTSERVSLTGYDDLPDAQPRRSDLNEIRAATSPMPAPIPQPISQSSTGLIPIDDLQAAQSPTPYGVNSGKVINERMPESPNYNAQKYGEPITLIKRAQHEKRKMVSSPIE